MQKYVLTNIPRPGRQTIEQFSRLDVSTVYEAQGKAGLMAPYLKPIIQGRSICGPAVTAICQAGDNLMIHAAIEVCQPGDVLVVATVGEDNSGMIGELIARALMKRGVQGVVIDSGIRDVQRLREMGFPVWTKAIHSRGTTKSRGGWVNAPAVCGGVLVHPGDLILADDDGVVVVAQQDLQYALESSRKRMEKEKGTKARIDEGQLSVDFYGLREVLEREQVVYVDQLENPERR
jgi:4-hydroxy-4-methyl-2-oxoglutarate aldolase